MLKRSGEAVALVTGGAGFIGSHLCDRLIADGWRVVCVDSLVTGRPENIGHLNRDSRFEFIEADVIRPLSKWLNGAGKRLTHIFHLACAASPPQYQADPEHTMLTNVVGTNNLLRLAERVGAPLLLTSTSEVYGDPEVHPQSEAYRGAVNCTGPRACYDEGKRAAETLAFDYLRAGRCDVRVPRLFNTYGPRMSADDGRVVSNVISQALTGQPITVYGDGLQSRSFCYVDDIVEALLRTMHCEALSGVPVNLGNPNELTVRELVDLVVELTGSASPIVTRPLPVDDPKRRKPNIGRAKEMLGWEPGVDLKSGLEATIAWFRDELDSRRGLPAMTAAGDRGSPFAEAAE